MAEEWTMKTLFDEVVKEKEPEAPVVEVPEDGREASSRGDIGLARAKEWYELTEWEEGERYLLEEG